MPPARVAPVTPVIGPTPKRRRIRILQILRLGVAATFIALCLPGTAPTAQAVTNREPWLYLEGSFEDYPAADIKHTGVLVIQGWMADSADVDSVVAKVTLGSKRIKTVDVTQDTPENSGSLDLKLKPGNYKIVTKMIYRPYQLVSDAPADWGPWVVEGDGSASVFGPIRCTVVADENTGRGTDLACLGNDSQQTRYLISDAFPGSKPVGQSVTYSDSWGSVHLSDVKVSHWVEEQTHKEYLLGTKSKVLTEHVRIHNSTEMTRYEYKRLHGGSSYSKVKSIVGGVPDIKGRTWKSHGKSYFIGYWENENGYAAIKFKNGKLTAKSWS